MKLLLATRNEHKRREFARLLAGFQVDALPAEVQLPPEDGDTFAANALAKARAAAAATGEISIADDSGIEAAALGGAPGVRSARYAGERATDAQNLDRLLREAPAGSPLAYVCALAYVDPATGVERLFEGRCTGHLAAEPRGERGFGYDPAFLPDDVPPGADGAVGDSSVGNGSVGNGSVGDSSVGDSSQRDSSERDGSPTMAQLSDEQKDAVSHRGHAARALVEWLRLGEGRP